MKGKSIIVNLCLPFDTWAENEVLLAKLNDFYDCMVFRNERETDNISIVINGVKK